MDYTNKTKMAELQPEGPAVREESRDPASHPPAVSAFSWANSAWCQALTVWTEQKEKHALQAFDDFYYYLQLIFGLWWDQEDIDYWIKGRRGREK